MPIPERRCETEEIIKTKYAFSVLSGLHHRKISQLVSQEILWFPMPFVVGKKLIEKIKKSRMPFRKCLVCKRDFIANLLSKVFCSGKCRDKFNSHKRYQKNKEEIKGTAKWVKDNPDKKARSLRKWKKKNPEKCREYKRRHQAKQLKHADS